MDASQFRPCPQDVLLQLQKLEDLRKRCVLLVKVRVDEFVVKFVGEDNYTVKVGKAHWCTCGMYMTNQEICGHIIWTLHEYYKLDPRDRRIWQYGLSRSELAALERARDRHSAAPHRQREMMPRKRQPLKKGDSCPICCDTVEPSRAYEITFCRRCGTNMHVWCIDRYRLACRRRFDLDEDATMNCLNCPLCRQTFSTHQELDKDVRRTICVELRNQYHAVLKTNAQRLYFKCDRCGRNTPLCQYRCKRCNDLVLSSACYPKCATNEGDDLVRNEQPEPEPRNNAIDMGRFDHELSADDYHNIVDRESEWSSNVALDTILHIDVSNFSSNSFDDRYAAIPSTYTSAVPLSSVSTIPHGWAVIGRILHHVPPFRPAPAAARPGPAAQPPANPQHPLAAKAGRHASASTVTRSALQQQQQQRRWRPVEEQTAPQTHPAAAAPIPNDTYSDLSGSSGLVGSSPPLVLPAILSCSLVSMPPLPTAASPESTNSSNSELELAHTISAMCSSMAESISSTGQQHGTSAAEVENDPMMKDPEAVVKSTSLATPQATAAISAPTVSSGAGSEPRIYVGQLRVRYGRRIHLPERLSSITRYFAELVQLPSTVRVQNDSQDIFPYRIADDSSKYCYGKETGRRCRHCRGSFQHPDCFVVPHPGCYFHHRCAYEAFHESVFCPLDGLPLVEFVKNIDVCLELLKKYRIFDASEQTLAAKCAACRSRLSKPSKSNFVVAECGCMMHLQCAVDQLQRYNVCPKHHTRLVDGCLRREAAPPETAVPQLVEQAQQEERVTSVPVAEVQRAARRQAGTAGTAPHFLPYINASQLTAQYVPKSSSKAAASSQQTAAGPAEKPPRIPKGLRIERYGKGRVYHSMYPILIAPPCVDDAAPGTFRRLEPSEIPILHLPWTGTDLIYLDHLCSTDKSGVSADNSDFVEDDHDWHRKHVGKFGLLDVSKKAADSMPSGDGRASRGSVGTSAGQQPRTTTVPAAAADAPQQQSGHFAQPPNLPPVQENQILEGGAGLGEGPAIPQHNPFSP
ncbi:uncharacterized protein LOC135813923 isoform X1 [Sycon ciliatum]|uniref:uncharacterized protein LOC135813923 isoform X1 n=1 Tax=Sycon ciliatum TaxID=27933 RepID=UPI0031F6D230